MDRSIFFLASEERELDRSNARCEEREGEVSAPAPKRIQLFRWDHAASQVRESVLIV